MKLSYDIDNTIAILIGTGKYAKNDFIPIDPVKGNLEDLKNILLDKDIFGLLKDNIFILEDKTNLEIVGTLKEILSDMNLKTVFLYYSGHGQRTSKDRLYLTAYNSVKDFDLIEYSGIEFSKFKRIIENSPGKPNSIVIIDACYSGIAAQDDSALTEEERTINGAYIITSSSNKEQSFFDPMGKHTFFTDELIDILNNGSEKSDMLLSIDDIYDNLQKRLRSKNLSQPQRLDNLDTENFYLAKNKKYNKEIFLRKAEEYFKDGNYSRAIEYYYTLQERFNTIDYSKFIDTCRDEINYSTLAMIADNLYANKKYELALIKYTEARKLKSNSSLLFRIHSCEEYIRMKKELIEEQQKEIEEEKLIAKNEAELKVKREEELKAKEEEEELKAKREEELKAKREEELKAKEEEEELKAKREEELKAKREEELRAKREKELKAKREEELNGKREEELKRNENSIGVEKNIKSEIGSVSPISSTTRLQIKSIRDYKYSKYVAGFLGVFILGYIIFNSSPKSDIKETDIKKSEETIQQPKTVPFQNKDSVKNELNKYLFALYNEDSAYSNQKKISFTYQNIINVPLKYNPFFAGDDYSLNKLLFRGINLDSLINSIYRCDFTLIGEEDSIEASLTANINNNYESLEIISVQYEKIIPLNRPRTIIPIQRRNRRTENNRNRIMNREKSKGTPSRTNDEGPPTAPIH